MINNKLVIYEDKKFKVNCGEDVFKRIKSIDIDYQQENFLVFYLNTKNGIIGEEILFKGGVNACLICPNTLFRKALLNNSDKIIVAHNHPSGDLTPSSEDIMVFEKLKEGGEVIELKVLDSIIFNKEGYYSQIELN